MLMIQQNEYWILPADSRVVASSGGQFCTIWSESCDIMQKHCHRIFNAAQLLVYTSPEMATFPSIISTFCSYSYVFRSNKIRFQFKIWLSLIIQNFSKNRKQENVILKRQIRIYIRISINVSNAASKKICNNNSVFIQPLLNFECNLKEKIVHRRNIIFAIFLHIVFFMNAGVGDIERPDRFENLSIIAFLVHIQIQITNKLSILKCMLVDRATNPFCEWEVLKHKK